MDLLIEYGIGVRTRSIEVLELDADALPKPKKVRILSYVEPTHNEEFETWIRSSFPSGISVPSTLPQRWKDRVGIF
jgi:hypothetical protein